MDTPCGTAFVIGAGPTGLSTALLLAKQGLTVTVYERLPAIPSSAESTYPIGVNPRGIHVLEQIDPSLAAAVEETGDKIDAWSTCDQSAKEISCLECGCVVITTRGQVAGLLYQYAIDHFADKIRVVFGQKLADIDLDARTLTFASSDGQTLKVDASNGRVFAADGVWSKARKALKEKVPGFSEEMHPWGVQFRVLYCKEGVSGDFDSKVHYIFRPKGVYTAHIPGGRWVNTIGIKDNDPDKDFLLATEATEQNITRLRSWVTENAPSVAALLNDDDYRHFFGRRTYSGAVVKVSRLNFGEWLVLLGDAGHALAPPTGEGTNAGLEDAMELVKSMQQATESKPWFELYNERRLRDAHAINDLAKYLAEGLTATKVESTARSWTQLVLNRLRAYNIVGPSYEDMAFGKMSALRLPYREMFATWRRQSNILLSVFRYIASWLV